MLSLAFSVTRSEVRRRSGFPRYSRLLAVSPRQRDILYAYDNFWCTATSASFSSSSWSPPILKSLDPFQKRIAIDEFEDQGDAHNGSERAVVVGVGRAGTGKTRAVAARAVHLMHHHGVSPGHVRTCVTL